MANIEKISISLPRDMIDTMKDAVERGDYATTSEVVRDAMRDWQKKEIVARYEALRPKSLAELRRMVQKGIDSLDRGEGTPAEEVFARLKAKYTAMARAQKANAKRTSRR
jgi:antitoxin ParD1/3/4